MELFFLFQVQIRVSPKVKLNIKQNLTWSLVLFVGFSSEPAPTDLGAAEALLRVLPVALVLVVEGDLLALPDETAREESDAKLAVDSPLKQSSNSCCLTL